MAVGDAHRLDTLILVLTVVAAILIGFGVPLLWLWIGSMLQGDTGATSVSFTVAVAVIMGIIATYALALCAAAWAQSRLASAPDHPTRAPWLRSMRDTPQRPGDKLRPLERVFVTTTLIVSAVFWVWFLFIAGSPLPNQ